MRAGPSSVERRRMGEGGRRPLQADGRRREAARRRQRELDEQAQRDREQHAITAVPAHDASALVGGADEEGRGGAFATICPFPNFCLRFRATFAAGFRL